MTTTTGPGREPPPAGSDAADRYGSSAPSPRAPSGRPKPVGGLRAPASWIESEWDESYSEYFIGDSPAGASFRSPNGARSPHAPPWDEDSLRQLAGAAGAPPTTPQRRRSGRIAVLVLFIAAFLVAAGVVAAMRDEDEAPTGAPQASGEAADPPTAQVVPQPLSPLTPAPVLPAGGGAVVTASILSGDLLDVYEAVSWPADAPSALELGLPDLAETSGIDGPFAATVTDLRVTVDGVAVEAAQEGSTTRWLVPSPTGGAPASMEVRYLLAGAVVRSTPSTTGRGLAVVSPLTQGLLGALPVRVEMAADGVLAMACPGSPDVASQLCGQQTEGRWVAEPPPTGPPVVVVQVDLPPL